jgi:hypothetical protein
MATKTAKKGDAQLGVRYIVNALGEKTEVVLPIAVYERILELLEDAEDVQDTGEVMKHPDFVPWEEAEGQLDEL